MREIEASHLFATAPVVASVPAGSSPGRGTSAVAGGLAPLNVASKIRLLGTVVGDAAQSLAVVEELTSKRQAAYRLHDQIAGLGEVRSVGRESILVGQGDLEEELFLDILQKPVPPPGSAPIPVGTVVTPGGGQLHRSVDRAELSQMLSDIPGLMSQARAVPYMNAGKMDGFRLDFILKGSFFEKLGLQAGDVLQRINGVELRDPGTALGLFQQLRNERNVAVDVLRNNQRTTLAYDIRG
jgi:general secretion pathway protein C